jgi:hypothetical protein
MVVKAAEKGRCLGRVTVTSNRQSPRLANHRGCGQITEVALKSGGDPTVTVVYNQRKRSESLPGLRCVLQLGYTSSEGGGCDVAAHTQSSGAEQSRPKSLPGWQLWMEKR